jgi:hypothetical protein
MSGGIITNHSTPLLATDVANKAYVDSLFAANFLNANTTLIGTTWTDIPLIVLTGQLRVSVKNSVIDGPSASFELTKSKASSGACIIRITSMAGEITNERLEMRWLANNTLSLRKTGVNYDGIYNIKIYLNS